MHENQKAVLQEIRLVSDRCDSDELHSILRAMENAVIMGQLTTRQAAGMLEILAPTGSGIKSISFSKEN